MFDPGIIYQVEGVNIDRPYNALTLTHDLHQRFGDLNIYFEPVPNAGAPNTYIIGLHYHSACPNVQRNLLILPCTNSLPQRPPLHPHSRYLLCAHETARKSRYLSASGPMLAPKGPSHKSHMTAEKSLVALSGP